MVPSETLKHIATIQNNAKKSESLITALKERAEISRKNNDQEDLIIILPRLYIQYHDAAQNLLSLYALNHHAAVYIEKSIEQIVTPTQEIKKDIQTIKQESFEGNAEEELKKLSEEELQEMQKFYINAEKNAYKFHQKALEKKQNIAKEINIITRSISSSTTKAIQI